MHVDIQPFIYFSFPKSTIYNQIYVKVQVFVFVFFTQLLWRCIKILLKPWLIKVWELFRCLIYFSIDWYLFQGQTHNFNFFFNSNNQLKDFYYFIIRLVMQFRIPACFDHKEGDTNYDIIFSTIFMGVVRYILISCF